MATKVVVTKVESAYGAQLFVAAVTLRSGRWFEGRSPEKPREALEALVDLLAKELEDCHDGV